MRSHVQEREALPLLLGQDGYLKVRSLLGEFWAEWYGAAWA